MKKQTYKPAYSNEFPFFGAGEASHFETFSLTIYFKNKPTKKQQKEIIKKIPSHYQADDS